MLINAIRRSQIDQPNGVAGLDGDGYLTNIGEIGHPPQINEDGAIEAIVAHRIDTLANLQAIGVLPEGEIVIEVDGSGVPVNIRIGDAAETSGGFPISGYTKVTSVNVDLTASSLTTVPDTTIILPANSIVELSGTFRLANTGSHVYEFTFNCPTTVPLSIIDGTTYSQIRQGIAFNVSNVPAVIVIPPTIIQTTATQEVSWSYRKISGGATRFLTRSDLGYRVLG